MRQSDNALAQVGVTAFAMEATPRTTRAQAIDALSTQAAAGLGWELGVAEGLPALAATGS